MERFDHSWLLRNYNYNRRTGEFTNRTRGKRVGWVNQKDGRMCITLKRKHYRRSRLAFFHVTGRWPIEIDHRNRDKMDDRWDNLREATHSQNQANRRLFRNNRAGRRGVHQVKYGRWRAMIAKDGGNRHLGYFDTRADAARAWKAEAMKVHGEFAAVR